MSTTVCLTPLLVVHVNTEINPGASEVPPVEFVKPIANKRGASSVLPTQYLCSKGLDLLNHRMRAHFRRILELPDPGGMVGVVARQGLEALLARIRDVVPVSGPGHARRR